MPQIAINASVASTVDLVSLTHSIVWSSRDPDWVVVVVVKVEHAPK